MIDLTVENKAGALSQTFHITNQKLKHDFRSFQPGLHPLKPFGDVAWTNDILQCRHIIRQQQQHGVGVVEGKVEDRRVNCLVIISIKLPLHIHHLDRNLEEFEHEHE